MPSDPLGPQQPICVFCWPYRDPTSGELLRDDDGNFIRDCHMCAGRDTDRWCECTYCDWL